MHAEKNTDTMMHFGGKEILNQPLDNNWNNKSHLSLSLCLFHHTQSLLLLNLIHTLLKHLTSTHYQIQQYLLQTESFFRIVVQS